MGKKTKNNFYAFDNGNERGIVTSWPACEAKVKGRKARYRGFLDRASAQAWLDGGAKWGDKAAEKAAALDGFPEDAVFFDSGTGRGLGAEVKVVDRSGAPIAHLAEDFAGDLSKEGTIVLGKGRTNNYGELLACKIAMIAAEALGSKHVYGDSKLVLDYWSKGHVTRDKRQSDPDLSTLADQTAAVRRRFEAKGGELGHVPGGVNPADLGFHRD